MFFKDIAGQTTIKTQLKEAYHKKRIPHAMLLNGPEGNGKMALALAFARFVLCKNRMADDACGTCSSCLKFSKLEHPDLHFIYPVVKKTGKAISDDYLSNWKPYLLSTPYISINNWMKQLDAENKQPLIYTEESRNIVKKALTKSYEGDFKFLIIYFPERMHIVCSNKLLKLLEEPPEKTVFLLVSENMEQLLPTILSRCQILNVPRIANDDLKTAIIGQGIADHTNADDIVRLAGGNLIKARELVEMSEENRQNLDFFIFLMRQAYRRDIISLKQWTDDIAAIGREGQKSFLMNAQRLVRENFILNFHQNELNYMSAPEKEFSTKFAPFINERNVIKIFEELELAQRQIEQNVNAKMVFFDVSLKMIMLLKS